MWCGQSADRPCVPFCGILIVTNPFLGLLQWGWCTSWIPDTCIKFFSLTSFYIPLITERYMGFLPCEYSLSRSWTGFAPRRMLVTLQDTFGKGQSIGCHQLVWEPQILDKLNHSWDGWLLQVVCLLKVTYLCPPVLQCHKISWHFHALFNQIWEENCSAHPAE